LLRVTPTAVNSGRKIGILDRMDLGSMHFENTNLAAGIIKNVRLILVQMWSKSSFLILILKNNLRRMTLMSE
jgi:hypothetical protein